MFGWAQIRAREGMEAMVIDTKKLPTARGKRANLVYFLVDNLGMGELSAS
jgi:hypothetical protein